MVKLIFTIEMVISTTKKFTYCRCSMRKLKNEENISYPKIVSYAVDHFINLFTYIWTSISYTSFVFHVLFINYHMSASLFVCWGLTSLLINIVAMVL